MRLKIKLFFALLAAFPLHAQEMGESAASSTAVAKTNDWKNWTFVGTAALTASLGVFLIAIDSGAHGHS